MKSLMKDLAFTLLNSVSRDMGDGASILMYHSISDQDNHFFTVHPDDFRAQMAWLAEQKVQVIALSELLRRMSVGESIAGCVVLTFDDGYLDNLDAVAIMAYYGFYSTIFVVTERLGQLMTFQDGSTLPLVSAESIAMQASSPFVEWMPHGLTHQTLDEMSFDEAVFEMEESRRMVERITERSAPIFAFPKGRSTPELVQYLERSGSWVGAVGVKEGLIRPKDSRFLLKRNSIDSTTTTVQFKGKVSGTIDRYQRLRGKG